MTYFLAFGLFVFISESTVATYEVCAVSETEINCYAVPMSSIKRDEYGNLTQETIERMSAI